MIMEFKEMSNQEKQWKAISLFAGAGGCSLGFKNAGVDILAAFENAEPAIITYGRARPDADRKALAGGKGT